jgi:hypothetical protein
MYIDYVIRKALRAALFYTLWAATLLVDCWVAACRTILDVKLLFKYKLGMLVFEIVRLNCATHLQRIKKERQQESLKKDAEEKVEQERIRTENILHGNPLLQKGEFRDQADAKRVVFRGLLTVHNDMRAANHRPNSHPAVGCL